MRYLVKDPNGREAVLDLTRGSAVRLLCRWCSEFGNRDPHEPCPVVSCDLHPFQTGADRDAQHRAVAVKDYCRGWCCMGDSWAADRCDVKTCALFPFRKGLHRTDRSVEAKEMPAILRRSPIPMTAGRSVAELLKPADLIDE